MKTSIYLLVALLVATAFTGLHRVFAGEGQTSSSASPRPELEYLKAINSVGHPKIRSCCSC